MRKPIAITGMGVVSPFGIGVEPFWAALLAGRSAIADIAGFDTTGFSFTRAGEVKLGDLSGVAAAAIDPATVFALTACREAAFQAGISGCVAAETGVVLATNFGGSASAEALFAQLAGSGAATARDAHEYHYQTAADHVAAGLAIGGPRSVLSLSCASGTAALAFAADLIHTGRAAAVVACGCDALSRFAWLGLSALRTITQDAIRPFDLNRSGTIFSEGAGALVLEAYDHALQRGAPIIAVLRGTGTGNNAHHMTAPAPEGAGSALVMKAALAEAGLEPEAIDHINAHGTGTKPNDVTETQAIKNVFGDHAYRMPITACKSMIGHMMGAAGSVEAIAAVLSIRDGIIPPTINFETPDPDCNLDNVVNEARPATLRTVLSNSAGIGGCNAAVILQATGEAS